MPVYANLYVTYMQPVYNSYANYYASGLTYMHYSSGGLGLDVSPVKTQLLNYYASSLYHLYLKVHFNDFL